MHFVLDEVVDQGHQSAEEQTGQDLAVLDSAAVVRAEGEAAESPGQGCHQVRDHENVVPVVIISRGNISPASTRECPEQAHTSNQLWQGGIGAGSQEVPKEDEGETRAGSNGNEDLEERAFRVAITDSGRHGREPFIRVAVVFVLDNLVEVQGHSHYQGTEEGRVGHCRMRPRDPFSIDLKDGQLA